MEDLFLGGQWSIILGYRRLSVKSLFSLILFNPMITAFKFTTSTNLLTTINTKQGLNISLSLISYCQPTLLSQSFMDYEQDFVK